MACFHPEGIDPSFTDLFIKTARGMAITSAPSFRSRGGTLVKPVDLCVFSVFSSLDIKVSLISESSKMLLARRLVDRSLDVGNTENNFCLNVVIADEKYLAKLREISRES